MAVGEDAVWVATFNSEVGTGTVERIDPTSNVLVGNPINLEAQPLDLAAGEDGVWVALSTGKVRRIDPRAHDVVGAPIDVGSERVGQIYPGTGIAVGGGAIWVTNLREGTVTRIDSSSKRRIGVPIRVREPTGVAVGEGTVWVTSTLDNTVTRIDPAP